KKIRKFSKHKNIAYSQKHKKKSNILQNLKTSKNFQNTKTIEKLSNITVPNMSHATQEFEVDSYDFDIELDFELMGLNEAPDVGNDDTALEFEESLEKFKTKANVVADDFEIVNLGSRKFPREVRIRKSLSPE
ncbi:hypothetical protein PJI17_31245, partial [Mycobacterium kansasii]